MGWMCKPCNIPVLSGNSPCPDCGARRSGYKPRPKGVRTHSKLTEDNVREIRAMAEAGEARAVIAKKFDVSVPSITSILTNRNWSDVK